jgi:hypothetical protein
MGLLTQDDVAKIQDDLKSAEAAMKAAQSDLDQNEIELSQLFGDLDKLSNIMSVEQKIINTETANINSYDSIIKDTKTEIATKQKDADAAKAAGNDALVQQLVQEIDALIVDLSDTEKKKDTSLVALDKAKTEFDGASKDYDATKVGITAAQDKSAQIKAELAEHTKNFNEYSNSPILGQFENEKKTRKEIASKAVKNKERIMPLLKNANTGLDEKMEEFTSDTNIFIKDIKTELGIDLTAEEIIKESIAELNAEYEKKGTEGVFMASKALELSRKSLFDLELAGINKLIKAACYKGKTSIKIAEHEITGTQIVALNEGGYKVSHEKVDERAKNNPEVMIIIDWGFVAPVV